VAKVPRLFHNYRDLNVSGSPPGSIGMPKFDQERRRSVPVTPGMETSDDYRGFAAECERLAEEAMTEEERSILMKMAAAWKRWLRSTRNSAFCGLTKLIFVLITRSALVSCAKRTHTCAMWRSARLDSRHAAVEKVGHL
jgi:hypothetical protein